MFGVDTSELIIVAVAALLFIGPKDLPAALRSLGRFIGKIRGMARHFNSGIEAMIRDAELEEMEKTWREENERIMREFPGNADIMPPLAAPAVSEEEPTLPLEEPPLPPPAERPLP